MTWFQVRLIAVAAMVSCFACSCASVDRQLYFGGDQLAQRLLPLEVRIAMIDNLVSSQAALAVETEEHFRKEALFTIHNDMLRNVVAGGPASYGYLVLRVDRYFSMPAVWQMASLATMAVGNLLGMPMTSAVYDVELYVEVRDRAHSILKTYTTRVNETGYAALYWGTSNPRQQGHGAAIRAALESIKQQLAPDIPELNRELTRAGSS